jgi:hypothetical protein
MIEYLLTVERTEENVLQFKTKSQSTAEKKERERESHSILATINNRLIRRENGRRWDDNVHRTARVSVEM